MRLGLLGGTFNPIHLGHLVLAECARQQHRLDQVWFIPAARPPHKSPPERLPGAERLALVKLAVAGHPAFRASDLELRRGGVSYTLDTVRAIRRSHPRAQLFLIVGADVLGVPWYGLEELSASCTFLVAGRPSARLSRLFRNTRRIAMPLLDISSSLIRARARRGQSIRYLVPDAVARAIARRHLYQGRSP